MQTYVILVARLHGEDNRDDTIEIQDATSPVEALCLVRDRLIAAGWSATDNPIALRVLEPGEISQFVTTH